MGDGGNTRISSSLLALSSAAVLAVYSAGYVRTRAAADRFAQQAETRRPFIAVAPAGAPPSTPVAPPAAAPPAVAAANAPVAMAPPSTIAVRRTKRPSKPVLKAPTAIVTPAPAAPVSDPHAAAAEAPPVATQDVAQAPAAVPPVPPAPTRYRDGMYTGWGTSRHGDIQAAVVIEDGRIASATIAQCLTRYSCNVIAALPPQVAQRQSPEVDYVSGATQSTNAFYYAVVDALSKAK